MSIAYEDINQIIIESRRKRMSLHMDKPDVLEIRVPYHTPRSAIDDFVGSCREWILKSAQDLERQFKEIEFLSREELMDLADQALEYIPKRVAHFLPMIDGRCINKLTIKFQKRIWGSCSTRGNITFNCLIMLAPPEAIDLVVVHELCHLLHMNHSPSFYELARKIYPEYDIWDQWLSQNSAKLFQRASRLR